MLEVFRKEKGLEKNEHRDESESAGQDGFDEPDWYDIGEENPFNVPVLDIGRVTLNVVATTQEEWISENYLNSRSDDGRQYIGQEIPGGTQIAANIRYPHNGEKLEGILSKAESMDVKWDIYAYGEWFYFVRSWTSELVYKVHYENTGSELVLDCIVTKPDIDACSNIDEQNIHSIILTHVFGRLWPYAIPEKIASGGTKEIAVYLFSYAGCKAVIAAHENVLTIQRLDK